MRRPVLRLMAAAAIAVVFAATILVQPASASSVLVRADARPWTPLEPLWNALRLVWLGPAAGSGQHGTPTPKAAPAASPAPAPGGPSGCGATVPGADSGPSLDPNGG